MKAPSERQLAQVASDLKKLAPGSQKAVGDGIYMRLDKNGRRRFQYRLRTTNSRSRQPGRTYDTWQAAHDARSRQESTAAEAKLGIAASRDALRELEIDVYAEKAWWPDCTHHLRVKTREDYRNGLRGLVRHIEGITLAQLEEQPLLIDEIKWAIAAEKTYADREGEDPFLHEAAADKPLRALSVICNHAVERNILVRNPVHGIRRFYTGPSTSAASQRPILQSEIKLPHTAALVGSGMRGHPVLVLQRRLILELIIIGMRPSDILAMRHRWWRDRNGPRRRLIIDSAVKDLAGHQIEGEPKTGERDLELFPAIAEWLERLYQLQGCSSLDSLVFPNRHGRFLDWGNFRDDAWYPALHRAGITEAPTSADPEAFYPYLLRHVGVTLMAHAERPQGGTYARDEVAYQFGNSVGTLDRVYNHLPKDMHEIGGLTMDQIIRNARRHVWGPLPGDPDHREIEYDLLEATELTGKSRNALAAQIVRGSIPGTKRKGRWYLTHADLSWHGLIPPDGMNR